ncbi:MAG: hypothetical protein WCY37_03720 [Candidatus Dojkabacteria bacterium]
MKRILFVSSVNLFKTGGGGQATLAYLDSIIDIYGRDNVDVMIPSECDIPKDYQNINYVRIDKRNRYIKYFYYFQGILSRFTIPIIKYISTHRKEYSICIINGGVVAGKSIRKINKNGVKTVVIHHNHEFEYHLDNKSLESLKGHFMYYIKKTEGAAYLNSDLNLFLTKQDMETFRYVYGNPRGLNYLLGCYDMKYAQSIKLSQSTKEYSLAISGTMSNYQTTVGVQDFYNRYFRISKRLIPDLKILITGRAPSEQILRIKTENPSIFNIIPNPKDILSIVQRGNIYLCPTNIGGGLKLRVMDGLKCGMPILVHKISARGYDYFYDKPYFRVYEDEKSFESGLSDLLFYLNNNNNIRYMIQNDYYNYFGFINGTKRMQDAFSILNII